MLWFEDDLFDALQLAQIEDRLAGRPGPVTCVHLPHPPRGDLARRARRAADRAGRARPALSAALRSDDPRGLARHLALRPSRGCSRSCRTAAPASAASSARSSRRSSPARSRPGELFPAATAPRTRRGSATPRSSPSPTTSPRSWRGPTAATSSRPQAPPSSQATAPAPRTDRWLGGVHLGPDRPDWAWDADVTPPGPARRLRLGGPDSNRDCQDQNLKCCQLHHPPNGVPASRACPILRCPRA